jgi:hypothetical protein
LNQLPKADFCRVNKKEIVAIAAVQFFNHNEISLSLLAKNSKPAVLVLSEIYRNDFLTKVKI